MDKRGQLRYGSPGPVAHPIGYVPVSSLRTGLVFSTSPSTVSGRVGPQNVFTELVN